MATNAEQIETIKAQALARIVEITAAPKPSYSIDGESYSWGEYLAQLKETVAWSDQQLASTAPFEIHSYGIT